MKRPYTYLGTVNGMCRECRALVPARVIEEGGAVYQERLCPACGPSRVRLADDAVTASKAALHAGGGVLHGGGGFGREVEAGLIGGGQGQGGGRWGGLHKIEQGRGGQGRPGQRSIAPVEDQAQGIDGQGEVVGNVIFKGR